ncbi:type II secretion system protein GspD [Candidatus Fukatsuia endosymbiont of Tuberolachnus salignus]|uniref:type II secretion system protein GspD n=1 Tax=Candidatus Fukatsuia endosymbiont of Tuberolachnus salignus TaxID=3077957 RepID=UPI00313D191E
MKNAAAGLLLLLCLSTTPGQAKGIAFELNAVPLSQALNLLYVHVFDKPFMLSPELAEDKRVVTFRITPDSDERAFILRYLKNMNIAVHSGKFNARHALLPSGNRAEDTAIAGTASDFINRSGDVLVYYGTQADVRRLQAVLPLTDTAAEEVTVAAYVFEVQTRERNGSGLALAAKLLSGKLDLQVGQAAGFDNFIRINTGSLDALYELFRTDSRFHVVSSPRLRVKNGAQASFSVGADVPVLGKVSYADNRPVQSVEYRSSGVILQVKPAIRADVIDLAIDQQLSDFVKTATGVNNSPTLTKRQVTTQVSVADGDIILLGGLAESKSTRADTGFSFLPQGWLTGVSSEQNKTDILVVLQIRKVRR